MALGDAIGPEGRAEVTRAVLDAGLDLSDERVRELVEEVRAMGAAPPVEAPPPPPVMVDDMEDTDPVEEADDGA